MEARPTPCRRAASRTVWVPMTLVRKKSPGSSAARLLWDSAAKCTTTSMRCSRRVAADGVEVVDVAVDEVDRTLESARLARFPA